MWFLKRGSFAFDCFGPVWTLKVGIRMIELLNNGDRKLEQLFTSRSVYSAFPVFLKFPFIEIHPLIDAYFMFHFEPLNNLFLGVF